VDAVAACAEQLGDDANTYGSAAAAGDLAAILDGLGVDAVNVYGDSYGTYLGQVFALRHPDRVRSLVLDGAYDDGFDPFARDAAAAVARSWATLCERARTCPGILDDIASLARDLADRPLRGVGVDGSGVRRRVVVDDAAFAHLLYDGAYVFTIYRDVPGAIAALRAGDERPFLRLAAEHLGGGGGGDASAYSEGAYAAVACHDYPALWDRTGSLEARRAELDAAIETLPDDAFAPLPNAAWLDSTYEQQLVAGCLGWPAPDPEDPPMPTVAPHPDLPVLVLNGEFDITTPVANARTAASAWPDATFVEVANEIHVTALYDEEGCATAIVRRFIRTLEAGDTSCTERTPEIHVAEAFPTALRSAPQATRLAGDRSSAADRRLAWVAGEAVGDALSRWWNVTYGGGAGLRGGRFATDGSYGGNGPLVITLRDVRFVDDAVVDGRVVWTRAAGRLRGVLHVEGAEGAGSLRLAATTRGPGTPATLAGSIDGRPVEVSVPMPWSP
jgi:pimeloyl-ACP methyl ester carboxylesterase